MIMNIKVHYSKPGHVPHTGFIIGCSPVALGVLFMRLDDGSVLAVDGYYTKAI